MTSGNATGEGAAAAAKIRGSKSNHSSAASLGTRPVLYRLIATGSRSMAAMKRPPSLAGGRGKVIADVWRYIRL